jgi:hypothetical protein
MSLILGFGKTEEDFEQQELDFVEQFLHDKVNSFSGRKRDFSFSDVLVAELKSKLKEREEYYDKLSKEYETTTDYPDRYTTYYSNILTDEFSDLCVVFKFFHIYRRHPMSSDGWALLKSKRVYHADIWDFVLKEL